MAVKKNKHGLFPMILGLILLATGLVCAHGEREFIQYAVRAPQAVEADKTQPNDPLIDLVDGLEQVWGEMEGSISRKTAFASLSGASITPEKGETAQAALHAVDAGYFEVHQKLLRYGRLIYPEEFLRGENVIVLDEDLAIRLFMISDPTGMKVTIGGTEYRVVGVIRHTRSAGEADLFGAYMPLNSIREVKLDMDMLTVTVCPIGQSGALSAFTSAMTRWRSGGCVYDLNKEAMRAGMLVRFALCAAAMYLLAAAIRRINRAAKTRTAQFRKELRNEYARLLMPAFSRDMLMIALGYAAALGAMTGVIVFAVEPVYMFTEWIPSILVEWTDLRETFWNLTAEAAKPVRCMTPEIIRIEFWARIVRWGLVTCLFGLAVRMKSSGRANE